MTVMTHPGLAFGRLWPSLEAADVLWGVIAGAGLYAAVLWMRKKRRNYRHGVEYGSARWGNYRDIDPFIDPVFRNNIPLTATERLMCSFPSGSVGRFAKPSRPKYGRNKNVLVVGGSGSGKTRFFCKPSIMQMHSSYVITDPKGSLILECGKMLERGVPVYDPEGKTVMESADIDGEEEKSPKDDLSGRLDKGGKGNMSGGTGNPEPEKAMAFKGLKGGFRSVKGENQAVFKGIIGKRGIMRKSKRRGRRQGYVIKVFNTIDFRKSMHFNPLSYIRCEKDILKFVTVLMENTKGEGNGGDPFWLKAERLLFTAYIGYMFYYLPMEERTFANLIDMIDHSRVKEEDEDAVNAIDLLFQEAAERDAGNFAVRQYRRFRLAAGKTLKSIIISCAARLAPLDISELREITAFDEMELELLGDRLTALFIIVSDTDDTFNFLAAIMYSQLFNLLCERADNVYGGHLPIHVRCICDEFANIGKIPNFEKLIATIRSREISASVILQSMSQLKAIYKESADTVAGNCDTLLFLGGKEKTTLKELSETLGKETIDLCNLSDTRGNSPSKGISFQKMGKELLSQDEIAVMDGGKCILQVRGVRPFLSDKYDITQHPMYRFLSDFDARNRFDVEGFVRRRMKLSKKLVVTDYMDLGVIS